MITVRKHFFDKFIWNAETPTGSAFSASCMIWGDKNTFVSMMWVRVNEKWCHLMRVAWSQRGFWKSTMTPHMSCNLCLFRKQMTSLQLKVTYLLHIVHWHVTAPYWCGAVLPLWPRIFALHSIRIFFDCNVN